MQEEVLSRLKLAKAAQNEACWIHCADSSAPARRRRGLQARQGLEPFREVECLDRASVSLRESVAISESGGGKALDADYREDEEMGCLRNDAGAYDITLVTAGKMGVISVDARSGKVGPHQEAGVVTVPFGGGFCFEGSPADMARMTPALSMGMSQVLEIAEMQGSKALAAKSTRNVGERHRT